MSEIILVTGGAGFIGSALIRFLIDMTDYRICCVDALTYAGNLAALKSVEELPRYRFFKADINDSRAMERVPVLHHQTQTSSPRNRIA